VTWRQNVPADQASTSYGAELNKLGEDISEPLNRLPARLKVIRDVRPKMYCSKRDVTVEPEALGQRR
jgi:transposase